MELFLTSSVHAVAHDIAKKIKPTRKQKLVFIDTAAELEKGKKQWLTNDKKALKKAGFNVFMYTITGKTKKQLENELNKFDFIYLEGGDVSYLLKQSQKTGFLLIIKQLIEKGKIYIGTSAGSIIAGPKLASYFSNEIKEQKLKDTNCYGFVPFSVVPHWGSEWFKKLYLKERIETMYKNKQAPFLLLTDNQYVHVKNGKTDFINVKGRH